MIIITGASRGIGKYLFDMRIAYIETMTSIKRPSLTGRIMYYIADIFFYQWRELERTFPKGKYCGLLL